MTTAPFFNTAGERSGDTELSSGIFGHPVRIDLVHQAVVRELHNRRLGAAATKTRSEVRGGGRKPLRQKGTGRARQGSIRAPHYRHGGIVHGPQPKDYRQDMPQKMRRAAFLSALSGKAADGDVRVVEGFQLEEVSTREFARLVAGLETTGNVVLVLGERDDRVWLSARNLPNVRLVVLPGLSTYEVVRAGALVFTQSALQRLEELYGA